MAKLNNMDSIIDLKFLKLDLTGNNGLKYLDFIYGSSSPVLAGDRH